MLTLIQALRDRGNVFASRISFRRAQKRLYQSRMLLVADNWDGSVQQFYHFMLGYFMPLCTWLDDHGLQPITVRDCGPMNIWFDSLAKTSDIQIIQPGSALHLIIGKRMKMRVLKGLDDPRRFNASRLHAGTRAIVLLLFDSGLPANSGDRKIVVIDRASSERFYHEPGSETHMSGQERRSIPNLSQLPHLLDDDLESEVVDFAQISPTEQIRTARKASVLVGQHGAGLVQMLWMKAPGLVIEIAPPLPPQVEFLFQLLAETLGHDYVRIPQSSVHAPVNLEELAGILNNGAKSWGSFNEEME